MSKILDNLNHIDSKRKPDDLIINNAHGMTTNIKGQHFLIGLAILMSLSAFIFGFRGFRRVGTDLSATTKLVQVIKNQSAMINEFQQMIQVLNQRIEQLSGLENNINSMRKNIHATEEQILSILGEQKDAQKALANIKFTNRSLLNKYMDLNEKISKKR